MSGDQEGSGRSGPAVARPPLVADVFLRDGLQAVDPERGGALFPTSVKLEIVAALDACGVPEVEVTGFVHPRVIPNLADADELARRAVASRPRARIRALVPNLRGAERALGAGVRKLAWLIAASPTYQRLNSNMDQERGLAEGAEVAREAAAAGAEMVAAVATAFVCPYEGVIPADRLLSVVGRVADLGVAELWLGESVGLAWPGLVQDRVARISERFPRLRVGVHLHTLAGLAPANALAALAAGAQMLEGAVGGVGAGIALPHPSLEFGNYATEDLNYLLQMQGIETGIDQVRLAELGGRVREMAGGGGSRAAHFLSLERYLERSRADLAERERIRPGDSRARAAAGTEGG